MCEETKIPVERQEARKRHWNDIVIPTAQALEAFLWRVAWFAVFVFVLRMLLNP